jgi:hypothetical protein
VQQPYPGGRPAEPARPPVPASLRIAVWLMYAGAALSLIRVVVDLVTESATRSAMRISLRNAAHPGSVPTASQIDAVITTTLALAIIIGIFSIGVWVFVARGTQGGHRWARIAGTVLFAVDTVAVLIGPPDIGAGGTGAALARIFASVIWVAGLGAVVCLWRKDSGAFFRAQAPASS